MTAMGSVGISACRERIACETPDNVVGGSDHQNQERSTSRDAQ